MNLHSVAITFNKIKVKTIEIILKINTLRTKCLLSKTENVNQQQHTAEHTPSAYQK